MKTCSKIVVCGVLAAMLSACANNENAGTMTGAVVGGLLGSQFGGGTGRALAIGGGALAGAMIGNSIGKRMDAVDRMRMQQILESGQDGRSQQWTNPNTQVSYTVEPVRTYTVASGTPCREYNTTAFIGGKKERVYGKACRQADGSWHIEN